MTKEEVIKQAYGEHWETVKDYVDENGWCDVSKYSNIKDLKPEFSDKENEIGQFDMRPYSLKGIETNNGWIKIESEQDLPKSGYYDVVKRDTGEITRATIQNTIIMVKYFSHYQPILEREKPIY